MKLGALCVVFSLFATHAHAFMSVQESNEITPLGKYKLGGQIQNRTSSGHGTNFNGYLDVPMTEASSVRAIIGTGDIDLYAGGSLKWVPIPDYGSQPAIGFKVGGYLWRELDENFTTIRAEPIISKRFQTNLGDFVPYGALPLMFNNGKNYDKVGVQLAAGTEFYHPEADNMTFGIEGALEAKDSFSYISGYVTIYLDDGRPTLQTQK